MGGPDGFHDEIVPAFPYLNIFFQITLRLDVDLPLVDCPEHHENMTRIMVVRNIFQIDANVGTPDVFLSSAVPDIPSKVPANVVRE